MLAQVLVLKIVYSNQILFGMFVNFAESLGGGHGADIHEPTPGWGVGVGVRPNFET